MINKKRKILIIGLGLIGGSYAKRLKQLGFEVGAITLNQKDIDYAIENNIIDHGFVEIKKEYTLSFDIIVFALYPKIFKSWIESNPNVFKKGAIVTDVTGVKSCIIYDIEKQLLDQGVYFVASHPMAGKEVYGVENASSTLFVNANFIITPTLNTNKEAIETIIDMGKLLGFANISTISPEKHDEMIAFLSQLTHCIAITLMTCKDSLYLKDYTGDSFRDLTRIANINENMWSELFLLNKQQLLSQMELFEKEFDKLKLALENEDEATIKEMMKLSTYRRSFFNKK